MPDPFWSDKEVLITGHTGFTGMWLALVLKRFGARVIGMSLQPSDHNFLYNKVVSSEIFHKEYFCDIRNYGETSRVMNDIDPHIVMHLAAQPLVLDSYVDPIYTFETNVMGTANILNSLRGKKNLKSILCVTSDKCYKNNDDIWAFREHNSLGGRDPYSASKASAEIICYSMAMSYFQDCGVSVGTARAGNIIGGGDFSKDRIVPDLVAALRFGNLLTLRNPSATRPWQHVLDPISAYLKIVSEVLFENYSEYRSYNIGPDISSVISVHDLVDLFLQKWGNAKINIEYEIRETHEAKRLSLDTSLIHMDTSWRPTWDFDRTVESTAQWYRDLFSGQNALELCTNQIKAFFD